MLLRIWAVLSKEFVQIVRDKRTLMVLLAVPLIQLLLFGFAVHMTVEHIPTVVADASLDAASRAFVEAMVASGFFDVVAYVPDERAVIEAIDRNEAQVGVVLPPRFAAQEQRGEAEALILIDGADMFTARSAYDAATAVAQAHSAKVLIRQLQRSGLGQIAGLNLVPLEARVRILYNPNLADLVFLLPSMLAMIIQTHTMAMIATAIVRERETGTIEQLLVTPIRPLELMIGKIAPNALIGLINMLSILALGVYGFGVPFRGDFGLFIRLSLLYVGAGLSLGLLISTISQNQNQTIQLVMVFALLGVVLSGFMFPREGMPPALQVLSYLFPLTHFIPVSRGIVLKGVGAEQLGGQITALILYVFCVVLLASLAFRQRLD
ncbi:MAG: ABC transporter permease [Chloroflexi bacterium]|nr:ABC transporter permease [Chloroflexota bacterium]